MSNHDRGIELTREVFQQEIGVMLTDYRAVRITGIMSSYPIRTKHQILEWIGANIEATWQPFPERDGPCWCGCDA